MSCYKIIVKTKCKANRTELVGYTLLKMKAHTSKYSSNPILFCRTFFPSPNPLRKTTRVSDYNSYKCRNSIGRPPSAILSQNFRLTVQYFGYTRLTFTRGCKRLSLFILSLVIAEMIIVMMMMMMTVVVVVVTRGTMINLLYLSHIYNYLFCDRKL